jgi:peroxiredoxin
MTLKIHQLNLSFISALRYVEIWKITLKALLELIARAVFVIDCTCSVRN